LLLDSTSDSSISKEAQKKKEMEQSKGKSSSFLTPSGTIPKSTSQNESQARPNTTADNSSNSFLEDQETQSKYQVKIDEQVVQHLKVISNLEFLLILILGS
jgi:hypothetical protein